MMTMTIDIDTSKRSNCVLGQFSQLLIIQNLIFKCLVILLYSDNLTELFGTLEINEPGYQSTLAMGQEIGLT